MPDTPIADLILRRTLDIEGFGAGIARDEIMPALDKVSSALSREMLKTPGGTTFNKTRRHRILIELNGALKKLSALYPEKLDKARAAVIQDEYDFLVSEMNTRAGLKVAQHGYALPTKQIRAMLREPIGGSYLDDWINTHIGNLGRRIRSEMTQSVILGETQKQAAARLVDVFGHRATRNGVDLISRTAMMNAGNQARGAAYKRHSRLIERYRAVATLDLRTCLACAEWDGEERRDLRDLPAYPLHPRCRCVIVPVTRFERDDVTRAAVTEQEKRVVHHRDGSTSTKWNVQDAGQISARTDFERFFKSQPAEWQKRYLGPARYQMLKSGRVSFDDFAQNNRPLTLADLRERF